MNMTGDMAQQAQEWTNDITTIAMQIVAAESELKEARTVALKKKHIVEELHGRLIQLSTRGPFGSDGDSPGLLDNNEIDEDSTRTMNFPRRVYDLLDRAGIETISRLESIIDGSDSQYVGGLDLVPGMDADARDRIMAQLNDASDTEEVPSTVPYSSPLSNAVAATPKNVVAETTSIRVKVQVGNLEPGHVVEAMIMPSGQAIFEPGEGEDSEMLESNEFELVID
jgi:hypothetical protein